MQEYKKRSVDDTIAYLLQSKKDLQEEIRNDVHTEEFQKALAELRHRNK